LSGWYLNSSNVYTPYTEAGVLVVNGNGLVTSGFDDYFVSTSVTGTYSITNNGTGTINLLIANSMGNQPLTWGITITNPGAASSAGSFAVIEGDSFANSAGAAYQQSAATLATAPTGTYVFRTHVTTSGISIAGSQASVGLIDFASNGTVTGSDDFILLSV
jgi:PKD repeat protein